MSKKMNSHPFSSFWDQPNRRLEQLRRSGRPEWLTVEGRPALVVQDAAAYERLLDRLDRAEAIAGIQRGLDSKARGEGRPMREALRDLGKAHGIELER